MPTWQGDLDIEEARLRVLYKLLHGLVDADIRNLHISGDVRTKFKEDLEIKGWNRNGWLPLETWSVLERGKPGWAWSSVKLNVWFVRGETEEALGIPMKALRDFLRQTTIPQKEELRCTCGKPFKVVKHSHPSLIKQEIQWTDHGESHKYHSACLFVEPEAFPMAGYLGRFQKKAMPPGATGTTAPLEAGRELERLRMNWRQVIAQAPEDTKRTPVIAILRSAGVKPVAVENDTVVLAFRYPLHKEKMGQPENQRVAEKIISNFLGHSCHVRCTYEPEDNHLVQEALKMGAQIIDVEVK